MSTVSLIYRRLTGRSCTMASLSNSMKSLSIMNSWITDRSNSTSSYVPLRLNTIAPNPGATSQKRRVGRGVGSGRGKTCKRGMKGTKARQGGSVPLGFEGGQTPIYKRLPKRGFKNGPDTSFDIVSVQKIQEYIAMGRLKVPSETQMITLKDLQDSGVVGKIKHGLKVVGGKSGVIPEHIKSIPLHLEVCSASSSAIEAIESRGGTVTCSHFNRLALRSMLKPEKFDILPRRARPPPKLMPRFLNYDKRGYLSPEIQLRNLELFGKPTSESVLKDELEGMNMSNQ